jgi:hypothetical protein
VTVVEQPLYVNFPCKTMGVRKVFQLRPRANGGSEIESGRLKHVKKQTRFRRGGSRVCTAPFRDAPGRFLDCHYLPPLCVILACSPTIRHLSPYHAVTTIYDHHAHSSIRAHTQADRGPRIFTARPHPDHATLSPRPRADYHLRPDIQHR